MSSVEPVQIGRYEILSPLGQGGMGTVYKAHDPVMDRWVAIKTVTVRDAQQRARFQQEVRAAGKLNHPHIITVYDVGEQGELAYIVMELVEGQTLAGRLSTPNPWPEAIELLRPICQALAYAHSQGVIHRDVKPANILISAAGQVKLTDFGVARLEAALRRITESGSTVGTPLYTAPEQLRNEAADGRADLFSVGIVLFELITGQHPFPGETLAQVVYQITQPQPANVKPLAALAPPSVVELVGRALRKAPAARFARAEEMAVAMESCLAQPNATLPPPSTPTPSPSPTPLQPIIEIVPSDLRLSEAEEGLLRTAFAGHDRLYLEREFSSGYSRARVLLITPVRSGGRRLAQVILKLDTPAAITQEWQAYQKYVKDNLPPVTARILEEPLFAEDEQLALLRYTFAGGLGGAAPESLRTYYAQHSGEEVSALLEKSVFKAFRANWWLQRQTADFIIRREYDRLLPVHLVVEPYQLAETTPTLYHLIAGKSSANDCRNYKVGQLVQIQDFTVEEINSESGELTLQAFPPSGNLANPLRVRVIGLSRPLAQQVGETVPYLLGKVTATRQQLLKQLAEAAFPEQDFSQKQLIIGGLPYPNPLYDYEALLDQHVSAMHSIIHGDLNLENILVTPTSGLAWLIDFATTRQGQNLYDFMRLETQVITKLLPQTRASPEAVARLIYTLHHLEVSPRQVPSELQKPLTVLAAIRRMVRVCMHNRENWDEYYLGLVIMLLGALKFKELDATTRRLTLAAAAAVRGLITVPSLLHTPTPAPTPPTIPGRVHPKVMGIAVAGLAILVILVGLGFWVMKPSPALETATLIPSDTFAATTSSSIPADTPFPTATPSSTAEVVATFTTVPPTPSPTTTSPSPIPAPNLTTNCLPPTFYDSLPNDYPSLGCSVEAWESDFTYQQFEQGLMVWRKSPDPSQIYVLTESGQWSRYEDPKGPPLPSCPEAKQHGDLGPIYSFGLIWCEGEWKRLGKPQTGEMEARNSPIEEFEGGLAFRFEQTGYVLLNEGEWASFPVSPTDSITLQEDFANQGDFFKRWESFSNEGMIAVGDGFLSLSSGTSNSFPYVRIRQNPFPATGNFTLEVEFQYTSVGEFGTGIVLGVEAPENNSPVQPEPDPQVERFKVWQDNSYHDALIVGTSDATVASLQNPDTNRHKIRFVFEDELAQVYLDGVLVGQEARIASRPTTLWFGNPYRTPQGGNWSELQIFSVSIEPLNETHPTATPSPTQNVILEDFEAYTTTSLQQTYALNDAGVNEIAIDITHLANAAEQEQVLVVNYEIKAAESDNYVGINRDLQVAQNWSNFQAMRFWMRNPGLPKTLVFQWGESQSRAGGGEVWRASSTVQSGETRFVEIPLTGQFFKRADWPEGGNNQMELEQVSYYGFYIESAPGDSGAIYLDSIELMPGEAQTDAPPVVPVACQTEPAPEFQALWDNHRAELGCATGSATVIDPLVEEAFEGGHLFWRGDTDEVYTIYDRQRDGTTLSEGQWEKPPQKWDGVSGCPGSYTPPPGFQKPARGFGWLWCTHLGGPTGPLGWALNSETPVSGQVQPFEHGFAFKGSSRKVYALLNNGRFLAYQLDAEQPAVDCSPTGFQPAEVLKPLWEMLGGGNGPLCHPLGSAFTNRNYARQPFERGFMFWWEAPTQPQPVWVINTPDPLATAGDIWTEYHDAWVGQWDYPPDCPEATPPTGPKRGFGLIWCYQTGVKDQVGRPLKEEFGSGNLNPMGAVQFFQGGIMFENPAERQVWALIYGGGWYRLGY